MQSEPIHGVLLVDKPKGLTSHDVINALRRVIKTRRIGHTGTLDPDATGLLVVCIGKATKVSSLLGEGDKTYEVDFELGLETSTYDSTGDIVARRPVTVSESQLRSALENFVGKQEQRPPIYSAIKVKGKKLYEYARQNKEVEIPLRTVEIFSIRLESFTSPTGKLSLSCSKGTYVRSFIHDLGKKLETGAVTTAIRRTQSGTLELRNAISLETILTHEFPIQCVLKHLLPISQALNHLPQLKVSGRGVPQILHGAGLRSDEVARCAWNNGRTPSGDREQPVLILGEKGEELALGVLDGRSGLQVQRVL